MFRKSFEQPPRYENENQDSKRASNILRRLEERRANIKEMSLGGDDENIDTSRRRFLRKASDVGKGTVVGFSVGGSFHLARYLLKENVSQKESVEPLREIEDDIVEVEEVPSSDTEEAQVQETSLESEKVTENPLDEIFSKEDMRGVVFDEELMRKASLYWKYMHTQGARKRDLSEGYNRMKPWEDQVCSIFEEEGVPRELAYLALPESYWNEGNWTSPAGAVGPYQIMGRTGEKFGVGSKSARENPLKSARAAAQILRENYKSMDGDWLCVRIMEDLLGGIGWRRIKNHFLMRIFFGICLKEFKKRVNMKYKAEMFWGVLLKNMDVEYKRYEKEISFRAM
jgi:hypothetical protein